MAIPSLSSVSRMFSSPSLVKKLSCSLFLAMILVVILLPNGSDGIKCYQCQSKNDPVCGAALPKNPETTHPAYKYLIDCNAASTAHVDDSHQQQSFTFCRKQVQDVDGIKNIVRNCGLVKGEKPCYTTGSPPTKSEVCQCFEDGCNGSLSMISPLSFSLLIVSLILIAYNNNLVFTP